MYYDYDNTSKYRYNINYINSKTDLKTFVFFNMNAHTKANSITVRTTSC